MMEESEKKKRIVLPGPVRFFLIALVIALTGVVITVAIWGSYASAPTDPAVQALASDGQVSVVFDPRGDGGIAFSPGPELNLPPPTTGLIFYPGGKVDYRAYSPIARRLAARGYLVVLADMPLHLAVFNPERATPFIIKYPEIMTWAVGGHSLGGAMAARYVYNHPDLDSVLRGLVLLAAYPADTDNLSNRPVSVLSISASEDGLATADKIEASRPILPANARFVEIPGGNHSGFGSYGAQSGDKLATISQEEQWRIVVDETAAFLASLGQ